MAFGVNHSFLHFLSFDFCCRAVLELTHLDSFETKVEDALELWMSIQSVEPD